MKTLLYVIDGFGVGECEDSYKYHDEGSNTFQNIYNQRKLNIQNLSKLGLKNIDGLSIQKEKRGPKHEIHL